MNRLMKVLSLFVFVFAIAGTAFSQEEDFINEEGEVVEGEFLINKELEISLPAAQRIFQKVPPDEVNSRTTEPLQYTFQDYSPSLNDIPTRLRVLKLKDEKVTSKPASYLDLGFGNYLTPYLSAGLNSGIKKTGNYGLNVYHLSSASGSIDDENSGDSHSKASLFGKYVGEGASIAGNLGYRRDGYHFYGYDEGIEVDRDSIKQTFNDINLDFEIKNSDVEAAIDYRLYANIYNISDDFNASELGIKSGLFGGYAINDNMEAGLGLDFLYASYKNPEQINRSLVRVHPSFVFKDFGLTLDIGMKVVNQNDTLSNTSSTQIFPSILAGYDLSDNIMAYAKLDGDVEEVTFRSTVNENPFIAPNVPLAHTKKNLDFQVGLKGSLIQYLAFDVGIRAAVYKNMYFYVNQPDAMNKFDLIYDGGNTSLYQGLISLSYFKGKTLGATLSTRLNAYSTDQIENAWHRPKFEMDYSFWYNFHDKIKFTTDMFFISGIEALDLSNAVDPGGTVESLDGAVDLNLKVDYLLSDKYSIFVSVNNLLNNNYQLYYRYPTRGLLAMVGFSVSF